MPQKERILDVLGEKQLLLPGLLNKALAANDRAKYYFSLLQLAIEHAAHPEQERPTLSGERIAAGEAEAALDGVIASSARSGPGRCRIPQAELLAARIEGALREMLEPLAAAGAGGAGEFARRLEALLAEPQWLQDGEVHADAVARMTSAARDAGDSVHLLVMDLHKALNSMQAAIASENIDGAYAYGLAAEDRGRVAAFMKGVHATRALKFDHPGLATTATRGEGRLVLQNDIGTTDAHVLVIHVDGLAATLTYTDVHLPRLAFLKDLLRRWKLEWADTRSMSDPAFEDGGYHLAVGTYRAAAADDLDAYLTALGSRLVFLIDWNRARKRLRLLVSKREALDVLLWAADNGYGHMAFLRIGAEQAVFDALSSLGKAPSAFGARLDDVLGRKGAVEFLRFALRISAEMLVAGKPVGLVLDELRGELFGRFHSVRQIVLDHLSEQVAIAIEIASGVRDCLINARLPEAAERFARNASRAKLWERRADELVNVTRELAQQSDQASNIWHLAKAGDDIADELEEAAFHLTLLPPQAAADDVFERLTGLAGLVVEGTQEYIKAIEAARVVRRGVPRADVQDFFESVHRIVQMEQQSDEIHRAVKSALLGTGGDLRSLYVLTEISRNLEAAADALMHGALMLRDHVLTEVMAG
jgi:uncharacterized protein Yka (UPF0111/DUF47 family)